MSFQDRRHVSTGNLYCHDLIGIQSDKNVEYMNTNHIMVTYHLPPLLNQSRVEKDFASSFE